jgi:hypothetical protein
MDPHKTQCLFKSWGHSREEDADGLTVYRPAGFKFPISRGRDGLEVRRDGTFVRHDPGPDDAGRKTSGSWKFVDDKLHVSMGDDAPRRGTIVQCDDDVLKVRWD